MDANSLHKPKEEHEQMRAVEFWLDEKLVNEALTVRKLLPSDWNDYRRKELENDLRDTKRFQVVRVNFDPVM